MAVFDSEWEKLLKKSQPSVFSDGIMFEILSRLPVKSIIRFKCVCKKWLELFGDSSFIAAHLKRSVDCNLVDRYSFKPGYYLSDENFEELRLLPFESEAQFLYEIVASVDGLVCICKFSLSDFRKNYVLLWNPATRESRTLPECPASKHCDRTRVGFGFDPKNKDYKVVMMTTLAESNRVDVYSLRNDGWRSFEVERFQAFHYPGAHLNGRLHWLATKNFSDKFIASFDLTDEKIIEIGVPDNIFGSKVSNCFGKFLILPVHTYEEETEVWFMKKYGDSKSWSILYNIPPHPIYGSLWNKECLFLESGKVIIQGSDDDDDDNMISYDPKNQVYKILPIEGGVNIVNYRESLVSVEGGRRSFTNS